MPNTSLVFVSLLIIVGTSAHGQTKVNCCSCDKVLDTFQNMFMHDRDHKYSHGHFVGFAASLSKHFQVTSDTKVIFDQIETNIGNHYKYKTGVFTAPRDGVYYFAWTIVTIHGRAADSYLVVNGSIKRKSGCNSVNPGSFGYRTGSASIVLQLKKEERVWIRLGGRSQFAYGGNWCSFQGWLLAKM